MTGILTYRLLAWTLATLFPALTFAQSADLVHSYQNLENAKNANKPEDAFRYGNEALRLTADEHGDPQNLVSLLRSLGDFAAASGEITHADDYYARALLLDESALGPEHPDLVPLLSALTNLKVKIGQWSAAEALLERTLKIEQRTYGEHHDNVLATLARLRDVYRAAGDLPAVELTNLRLQRAATLPRTLPAPATSSTQHLKPSVGYASVRVFYGTNRAPSGDLKPALYYGGGRGDLSVGYVDVTIPNAHKEAELETQPRWVEYTVGLNPTALRGRYVLLDKLVPLPREEFTRALREQVKNANSKDIFLFVHGFNTTFEDAARRAAQLAFDLDFDGTPMLYSWPSQGSTTAYAIDEAAVGISGRRLADFLDMVMAQSGAQRVHLLAHSMGNRALIEALQTSLAKRPLDQRRRLFGQIVFTAPDVDRDYFMDAVDALRDSADRVTLYASDNDYALRSSQLLHGAPRAGTAGDVIVRLAGIDTIDMSAVPADALGHSYFAANAGAIFDIFRLLWRGDAPPQRCGMSGLKGRDTLSVWLFNADICKGDDLLQAGVMVKRFGNLARSRVLANIASLTDPSQKKEWSLILTRLDGLLNSTAAATTGTVQ